MTSGDEDVFWKSIKVIHNYNEIEETSIRIFSHDCYVGTTGSVVDTPFVTFIIVLGCTQKMDIITPQAVLILVSDVPELYNI